MRKIAITTLLTLLVLSVKAATGENKITRHLTNDMYCFFTQTLKSTYDINDEEKLYRKFLSDHFKSRMDSKNKVNLKINRQQLTEINKRLFIRDYEHYYYFFPELKYARSKQSVEPLKSSYIKNNPEVPFFQSSVFQNNRKLRQPGRFCGCFIFSSSCWPSFIKQCSPKRPKILADRNLIHFHNCCIKWVKNRNPCIYHFHLSIFQLSISSGAKHQKTQTLQTGIHNRNATIYFSGCRPVLLKTRFRKRKISNMAYFGRHDKRKTMDWAWPGWLFSKLHAISGQLL